MVFSKPISWLWFFISISLFANTHIRIKQRGRWPPFCLTILFHFVQLQIVEQFENFSNCLKQN